MALDPKIIAKLKKDLAEINKIYKQLNMKPLSIEIETAGVDDILLIKQYLREAKELTEDLNEGFGGMAESIKNIVREWKSGFADPTKEATKSFTKLKGLAEKFSDDATGLAEMKGKEVAANKKLIALEVKRLTLLKDELTKKKSLSDAEETILANLNSEYEVQKELLDLAEERVKKEKKIQKSMGLTGAAVKSISGALGKIGMSSSFFEGIEGNMRETAKSGGKFAVAMTGLKGIVSGIGEAITDPLVVFTMIVKSVKFLVGIFDHVLKLTNKIGQSVGVAGYEAKNLKAQMHAAGDLSGDMFYNTEEMAGAYSKLNKAAGMNLKFNAENAQTFQDLTLYMGVSEEAAAQLFKISAQTGKSFNEMYDQVRDITQSLNESSGYSISTQDAIEAIGQSSGTVRFNIKGGTEGLVKAAHTANRLGLSMNEIAAAAATHLDFESSIAKEIEAEMFLQKDLNLDKLRYAALTGDTAMAAAEEARLIKENYKSLKGNVLAQQAFSDATGISMESLGTALSKQEELDGLSGKALKAKLAEQKAQKEMGQDAQAFDRTMANTLLQIKAMLEPLAKVVGPMILGMAKAIGPLLKKIGDFAKSDIGKGFLKIAGVGLGTALAVKGFNKLKARLTGVKTGDSNNTYTMDGRLRVSGDGGSGSGMDMLKGGMKGNIFKYLGKKGGLSRTLNRGLIRMFGKTKFTKLLSTRVLGPMSTAAKGITKESSIIARAINVVPSKINQGLGKVVSSSGSNLEKNFGTNNMSKIAKQGSSGNVKASKMASKFSSPATTKAAAKGGNIFSRGFSALKGAASKGMGMVKSAGSAISKQASKLSPMKALKKAFKSPLAKGFGKVFGPIMAAVEGIGNVRSSISNAKAAKMAGENIDLGALGKEIVQGAAYPIANLATNLIPGIGPAVSLLDGVASAFNLSPIKWLTDNLIDLIPNDAFTGLGKFAVGDDKPESGEVTKLATGGIVTGATNAIVGEAGPEAVIPLREFYAKFDELISAVNKGGSVYLDGNKVGYSLALQSSKM